MSKRSISDVLNDKSTADTPDICLTAESSRPSRRARLDDTSDAVHSTNRIALAYPDASRPTTKQTAFQQPTLVLSFSCSPSRTLEFTDSAMRYFVEPPLGAQLSYGYERWVRKPDEKARIDGLLEAFSKAKLMPGMALHDVGVVSWRGVMTRILTSPYEEREGWELNVMFVNGTLYFEEHLSEARISEKNTMEPRHRLQTYYGYAFESYCTSETPARKVSPNPSDPFGWGGDVDTNVQWCSVVRTKLGNTRLLIGGEVDCVRGKYTHQTDTFVELKTSLAIRGPHDEAKFEKKLLKFYFQSFLLGVPEILVGFRTPSGVLTTTQTFKTIQIPRLVRGKPGAWDPLLCLDWGNNFICCLKDVISRGSSSDTSVWRVRFTPQKGITVEMLDPIGVEDVKAGEDRVGFLPTWYWNELHSPSAHKEPEPLTHDAEDKAILDKRPGEVFVEHAGWQI
ncbi:putative RAI1-domain-containing protein [Lyophyllum shimeji]|uniref:Decapping nuclease n=1 Tax=Lyophyllum shimeji TaxID=47721 RepID=A0A9P3UPF9_LYOSH|nr:putative RAI1-domain-containing protein [Lyophyllum shimeji]